MIFTFQQIKDIISILQRHQFVFIASQLGVQYLTQPQIDILKASGVDLDAFKNSKGIIEQAFLFGILSESLGDDRAKKMNYSQFLKFIKSGNFVPLTTEEEFALEQIKNRAYTDITGLGSRIIQGTSNTIIRVNIKEQVKIQKKIKDKAVEAVKYRKSASELASDLGHATDDWERDWLRIAYYVLHEAYNYGRARSIFREHGEDAEVYFDVYKGACRHCKELYLEDPDDENSRPIIFKLKDILANGNNIGRRVRDYLPTVSPVHPYCRCTLVYRDPKFDWDDEMHAFVKERKYKPKNKKLQGVKLNIKVTKGS